MNPDEYEKMYLTEEDYWWFRGRRTIVYSMFRLYAEALGRPLRILDLGCGTGKCLRDLSAMGHQVTGVDFSAEALDFTRRRGGRQLLRADATALPFHGEAFDAIIALDIMEHVESDVAMAGEMHRVLRPGGVAIVNVPAHPFLWSEHDVALHHFRRYTRAGLLHVLHGARFSMIRFTYSIFLLFFPAVVYRLFSNLRPRRAGRTPSSHVVDTGGLLNRLFHDIIRVESFLMKSCNMPMGLSLLAVVRKEEGK